MECETQIEAVLRSHPAVREARVVRSENLVAALVIPEDRYVEETLGFGGIAAKIAEKWRKIFDLTQFATQSPSAPVGFNTLGWNSSYTRQPFSPDQMRDWVESTVEDIRSLAPMRVYEIGCGTGLLLTRIAPECERYIGSDFSPAVLASLEGQLSKVSELGNRVHILNRAADNFDGLDQGSVDTVIINSVVQYFPSINYLTEVLDKAVNIVEDGGHIFVGDVLSLPLQNLFATSVALFQATSEVSVVELRSRIQRRVAGEPQLILSPAYFLSLRNRFPRVSRVEIRPRRDRADTEMSRYRYHAILHIGHPHPAPVEIKFLDWNEREWSVDEIRSFAERRRGESIGFKSVKNRRLEKDLALFERLSRSDANDTAAKLRGDDDPARGIHPQQMLDLGAESNVQTLLSWAACRADGSYDVAFIPAQASAGRSCIAVNWPEPEAADFMHFSNAPGQGQFRTELKKLLLEHCRQHLPEKLIPQEITFVDALPERGKL